MKILAVTSKPDRPEHALMNGLVDRGHTLDICAEYPETLTGIRARATHHLPVKARLDPAAILRLRRIVQDTAPDIIHSYSARSLTTALMATIGISVAHVAYRGTIGHLSRWSPLSWLSFLHPRVHGISCVSGAVRDYMLGLGISPLVAKTIYKGHQLSWYEPTARVTRADFGIPDKSFVVGFTGNMRPVKGADILLEATNFLPNDGSIHLLLIGEMRDREVTRRFEDSPMKSSIHLVGYRDDATNLISLMDTFCMPSREREGLPKAVIEAMTRGVPPIVSRVGGMPELVRDGDSGIVIPPSDPKELARAILTLKDHPEIKVRLSASARERISSDFTIQNTIDQTIDLYETARENLRRS